MTFQDLVDEWTSFVSDILTDQNTAVPDGWTTRTKAVSYGLDLRRKIAQTVLEMQAGGEPVGVAEEVAVADLFFEFITLKTKQADGKPPAFEQHHDLGLTHLSSFRLDPRTDPNHGIDKSQWNTRVQLGSRSITFRQAVRGWAAEVWLIYEAQDPAGHNPRDWTLHDFVGALSFRSILFRAHQLLESDIGREVVIPSVDLTDKLFEFITQPDSQDMIRAISLSPVPAEPFGKRWWWGRVPANGPILEEFRSVMERIRSEQ